MKSEILMAKANRGDSVDKMNLADILLYGNDVPEEVVGYLSDEDIRRNLLQAISLYKEVTTDNDFLMKHEAYFRMGCAYNDLGEGKKALSCFKKAAGLNCHEAFARVGDAYLYAKGNPLFHDCREEMQ